MAKKDSIVPQVKAHFGDGDVSQKDLIAFAKTLGRTWSSEFNDYKIGKCLFNFSMVATVTNINETTAAPKQPRAKRTPVSTPIVETSKTLVENTENETLDAGEHFQSKYLVAEVDPNFVPYGYFNKIVKIFKSNRFYPVYVFGPTGVGKSTAAIQAAAKLGKNVARVVITEETTDDDLFGKKTLRDGNLQYEDGILTIAAELGFPLIIDEISAGDPKKLFGLYTILEGKRHFVKDANKFVSPKPGFTLVVTDNTQGKGDDSGAYVGTNILNEAFLDRFAACYEQSYPTVTVETDMLTRKFIANVGQEETAKLQKFIDNIIRWANIIRKTHEEGAVDETVSPRRLLFIPENYAIFGSQKEAIDSIITRFDSVTREAFKKLWDNVNTNDGEVTMSQPVADDLDDQYADDIKF